MLLGRRHSGSLGDYKLQLRHCSKKQSHQGELLPPLCQSRSHNTANIARKRRGRRGKGGGGTSTTSSASASTSSSASASTSTSTMEPSAPSTSTLPPPPPDPTGALAAVLAGRPNPVEESAGIDDLISSVTAEASAVLAEIRTSSKKKKKSKAGPGAQGAEEEEELSDEIKAKLKAAELKTLNALNVVRGTMDGLDSYRAELKQYGDEQLRLQEQMLEAIENSRRMRALIREEEERVTAQLEQSHINEPNDDGDGRRV